MHFYPTEHVALFIDGANLYATAKSRRFDIDYKRLLGMFRQKGRSSSQLWIIRRWPRSRKNPRSGP